MIKTSHATPAYSVDIVQEKEKLIVMVTRFNGRGGSDGMPVSFQPFTPEGVEAASRVAKFIQKALSEVALASAERAHERMALLQTPKDQN